MQLQRLPGTLGCSPCAVRCPSAPLRPFLRASSSSAAKSADRARPQAAGRLPAAVQEEQQRQLLERHPAFAAPPAPPAAGQARPARPSPTPAPTLARRSAGPSAPRGRPVPVARPSPQTMYREPPLVERARKKTVGERSVWESYLGTLASLTLFRRRKPALILSSASCSPAVERPPRALDGDRRVRPRRPLRRRLPLPRRRRGRR